MSAPTPRLVPDRPSDAAIAQALCSSLAIDYENLPDFVLAHAREIDAAAPPAEAPGEWGVIERAAKAIYDLLPFGDKDRVMCPSGKPAWVERGNSDKQELARQYARAVLAAAPAAPAGEEGGHVPVSPEEEARIDEAAGLEKISFRVSIDDAILLRREAKARGLAFPAYLRERLAAAPAPDTAGVRVLCHRLHQPNHSGEWISGDYTGPEPMQRGFSVQRAYTAPRVTGGREVDHG